MFENSITVYFSLVRYKRKNINSANALMPTPVLIIINSSWKMCNADEE